MVTNNIPKSFNIKDFEKLKEILKPKQIIYTSSKSVYDELIKLPFVNTEYLKLTTLIEGTYIVDMEKLNKTTHRSWRCSY